MRNLVSNSILNVLQSPLLILPSSGTDTLNQVKRNNQLVPLVLMYYKSDTNGINWFLSIYAFFPSMLVVTVEYHIINSLQS
jgi:hypothetical protein